VTLRIAPFTDVRTPALRHEWERQQQMRAVMRSEEHERNRAWARHIERITRSASAIKIGRASSVALVADLT